MFQANDVEKIKTYFVLNNFFFLNRVVYEIMWENIVEPGKPQVTTWCMRIARWIPNSTNTHTLNMQYFLLLQSNSGYANAP
jgi:hypothetical protein